jgi:hypothetical protein
MVYVRNNDRFVSEPNATVDPVATYNWADDSILAFRGDGFNPAAKNWPTHVNFVFDEEGNCDNWPDGFPVSDGAYIIGRHGGNSRFDGGMGLIPAAGSMPGDTIGFAVPYNPGNVGAWDQRPPSKATGTPIAGTWR